MNHRLEPCKNCLAVVGSGYWGKNLVRNFNDLAVLTHVCDSNPEVLSDLSNKYPGLSYTDSFEKLLGNSSIKAISIATPASSHFELLIAALKAGKDVLVEKPLALDVRQGAEVVQLARQTSSILMVGHILLYHPAILKLKEIVDSGQLGKILYIQSNRLGMGKVRNEENILWSFAPHDISIILYLLNEFPSEITAAGSCHLQTGIEDMTTTVLKFPSGVGAHIYVSWMNPFKEQRLVVIGDQNMAVFDDTKPADKLEIYNTNFQWVNRIPQPVKGEKQSVPFEPAEPLKMECMHFLECIRTRQTPRSDGEEGLRTLRVLQACYDSMKSKSPSSCSPPAVESTPTPKEFFAHQTAVIDEPCKIGKGTKIWHFSHIMKDATIGENCNIGANVLVGSDVKIGDRCKIQNNVSVYEGVTLEDYVFCGPSMVFTNVYNPRCEIPRMKELRTTLVKKGATLGANSTIVCGNNIGSYAFVGAGSVVSKDVSDYALVVGNPAKRIGWMCRCGVRLNGSESKGSTLECKACGAQYTVGNAGLSPFSKTSRINTVPLLDLKAQYKTIKFEIDEAIQSVAANQHFILGPEVEALEKDIAEYCEASHAVGVSSGSDALLISLMTLGIGPGDEVITTPFTFFATMGAILRVGATPIFADIEPYTYNIDPKEVEKKITSRTKACIPVHLFGQSADLDPIIDMSKKHGFAVVEDAAQAIGTSYKGKRVGAIGDLGCFSFFPSKNLGAFGDGGIVTTNNSELADKLRILRNHGAKPKYYHKLVGGNFRLDALQAAILRVKLRHLETWTEGRRANAKKYNEFFHSSQIVPEELTTPPIIRDRHIFNQYVIRTHRRDELKKFLNDNKVSTEIYYPLPLNLQECLGDNMGKPGDFPVSERAASEVLALPIYPELKTEHLEYVTETIKNFFK